MIASTERSEALQDLYKDTERLALMPHWLHEGGPWEPRRDARPWLWRWADLKACLLKAGEVMPVGGGAAERRALGMRNPSLSAGRGTTRTITSAVQMVYPGEVAPSHRHTNAALRFIIEGSGAYTIVNGQPVSMEPGDFLLTPSWAWHGHAHEGSQPMLWLDVLDAPLIGAMDWRFYEEFDSPNRLQPPDGPRDASVPRYATGGLLPLSGGEPVPHSPLFSYKWASTREALYRLTEAEDSPFDGLALAYTDPTSGGAVMPTIDCSIHLLPAGRHTLAHRHTTNTIYHVAEGSGFSVIDGLRFDWQRSDTFCVPNWCWHEHAAADGQDAVLFAATDAPVLRALHTYREQALEESGGHQAVTGRFEG